MDKYFKYLDDNCQYDYSMYAIDHKSRAHTFKYVWDQMNKIDTPVIVELGTTRSFVGGSTENGCMVFDRKYWNPDKPEDWDWGAGNFTRVFGELPKKDMYSVDIVKNHVWVAEIITRGLGVKCLRDDSKKFLREFDKKCDLIYEDVGDVAPLEPTARLQEENAKIIIERELIKIKGIVVIDDVRNPCPVVEYGEKSRYGKAKYSIGVYLANGFEIIEDQYQLILRRMS